jgi:hypothetical protein
MTRQKADLPSLKATPVSSGIAGEGARDPVPPRQERGTGETVPERNEMFEDETRDQMLAACCQSP